MKNILLSFLFCALFGNLSAQYILTKDGAPTAGDTYEQVFDTLAQVTKGGSGADQTWNFTDFDFDRTTMTTWMDAAGSEDIANFPEADLLLENFLSIYFDVTPNKMEWIGVAGDFGFGRSSERLSNPETIIPFPSAFNSNYRDTSAYVITFPVTYEIDATTNVDSARLTYKNLKNVAFDAWGTMITPLAVFPNSLREREYAITENKTEARVCFEVVPGFPRQCTWVDAGTLNPQFAGGTDTTVTYTWYNQGLRTPIATIAYNFDESEIIEASFNNDPNYTGIAERSLESAMVYPNPANDYFYLKGMSKALTVTITDITGKLVKSENLDGRNIVNIEDLENGNYIVNIQSAKGFTTDKLSVIRQ